MAPGIGIGIGLGLSQRTRGGDMSVSLLLTSTGTGVGVSTLKLEVSEDITLTLDGTGKFYDDAGGTTNEGTSRTVTSGALRTFYLKVPSSTSNLKFSDASKVTKIGSGATNGWTSTTNAASMAGTNLRYCTNLTNLSAFGTNLTGDVSGWSALVNLTYLRCGDTSVYGDVSGWSALVNLVNLFCYSTSVSGDVSGWSALVNLTVLRCDSTSVSGDVSGWSALVNLTYLHCGSTSITNIPHIGTVKYGTYKAGINTISTLKIDSFLSTGNTFFASNTPTANATYDISGTGMGVPTGGASNTDLVAIVAAHTAVSKTCTFTINT